MGNRNRAPGKSDFGSHAKMMINSKTSTEAWRLTVWNEAMDDVCEIDFRIMAARNASWDGRCLDERRPLCANSALLRLADTSNKEWKGIALSSSSLAAALEAASIMPSGSEDSDISPTSNKFGITYKIQQKCKLLRSTMGGKLYVLQITKVLNISYRGLF